jgi:hypothetical protein
LVLPYFNYRQYDALALLTRRFRAADFSAFCALCRKLKIELFDINAKTLR